MKAVKVVHSTLSAFDLFPAQQFLRYKGDPEYKTATGGFCSLVIVAIFVAVFINSGLNVLNKATVIVSSDVQHQTDPAATTLIASPEGQFMFAVNVIETGIADSTYTYFNVSLQQTDAINLGTGGTITDIPLVPCTAAHFNFSTDILQQYYQYNVGTVGWRCPPLGSELSVGGTLVSTNFKYFSIVVKKCDSSIYSNCAPDSIVASKMANTGAFTAVVVIIDTQINPSYTNNYRGYYIQTRNYYPFTTSIGVKAVAEIEDYEIDTDTSLLPLQSIVAQTGAWMPNLFQHYTIPVVSNTYVNIVFQKGPNSITYTRSFQKIDDFLSYVGGLIGLVFALIFIMNSYSESCFEISIGSHLFTIDRETPVDSASFNFLTYVCYMVFKICRFFGCCARFQMMDAYLRCQEEVGKQIDILTILQRISTLQKGVMSLVDHNQFQLLHFREKPPLQEVKSLREKLNLYKQYAKKDQEMMFWKDPQNHPAIESPLFSQQSSVSSMKTHRYQSLKRRVDNAFEKQIPLKQLNEVFIANQDDVKSIDQNKQAENHQQSMKKLIGEYYFLEQSNPHLKGANEGWSSFIRQNQKDQL